VGDERFDARLQLRTSRGSEVEGTFRVAGPLAIEARVTGVQVEELLRLTIVYEGEPGGAGTRCGGRIEGILTVEPQGEVLDGPVTIVDCDGRLPGRMSFRR